VKLEEKVE